MVSSFLSNHLVDLHLSQPYVSTEITLELKILSFGLIFYIKVSKCCGCLSYSWCHFLLVMSIGQSSAAKVDEWVYSLDIFASNINITAWNLGFKDVCFSMTNFEPCLACCWRRQDCLSLLVTFHGCHSACHQQSLGLLDICQLPHAIPVLVLLIHFFNIQSMAMPNNSSDKMQPCFTLVSTLNHSVVWVSTLAEHFTSLYVALMMIMTLAGIL